MRLAHLILAHSNPAQLSRLIGKLAHEHADIYIHLDLKTAIAPFSHMEKSSNVRFIKNRVKVNWGGYTLVQATLNGFEEILSTGKQYDYINLLSGQDYPIKKINDIHKYFAANPGKVFMHALSVTKDWKEALPRITEYHMPDLNFPGKYKALRVLNKITPKRKMPLALTPVGRSQWFTLTPASARYIVDYVKKNPEIPKFFKLSWAPDEMIFQTILYNSPYRSDMVNDNLLYIDWTDGRPNPKTLTMADADALMLSNKFFARKFNPEIDSEILDHLDKNIHLQK